MWKKPAKEQQQLLYFEETALAIGDGLCNWIRDWLHLLFLLMVMSKDITINGQELINEIHYDQKKYLDWTDIKKKV